ncbi:unnamed protein product [Candidula unifasciata]|uniref:Alpha-type protein kinase domain-containing protein n=1 Tax=Candidula unifasciata TaxID=100452 RepID=A0A8S3ZAL3_9EUPU|nr:unnamed protein product [Candidula unifasciata]
MRIFFLERDNVTQPSEPDNNGVVYSASFELFPFYEGCTYSHFKGLMNGEGPLRGSFCVVRAMLDKVAEKNDWSNMIRRSTEAQRLAVEFNKHIGYKAVSFQIPVITGIETLSDFACLFRCVKPHDKRLNLGEFVTIEPFLDGPFQKFDSDVACASTHTTAKLKNKDSTGASVTEDICSNRDSATLAQTARTNSTSVAQAFSHFSWHFTRNLIVCGLQGVSNGQVYTFTNPSIHSINSQFGVSDGSVTSIAEFFSYHRCNNICRNWEQCSTTGKPQRNVNFFHKPENSNDSKNHHSESLSPQLLNEVV